MIFKGVNCEFDLNKRTYVMGILNITPDSFSDGGCYLNAADAYKQAKSMCKSGADIIDVGGQSTRPGHTPVSAAEEWERIAPALDRIIGDIPVPVSVDTYYPEVAEKALEKGADIINDVSGAVSPDMAAVIRRFGAGWIIMHAQSAEGDNIASDVGLWLLGAADLAHELGVNKEHICLDPGIGFGKNTEENLILLRETQRVKANGYAYMVGASRKRVIGSAAGGDAPFDMRDPGTIAAHTIAIAGGANIIRAHDVAGTVQAARVADAVLRA